jgi:hypothetical protein
LNIILDLFLSNLEIEDLNAVKNSTNLVELSLEYNFCHNLQEMLDFICDNFSRLKSFCLESRRNHSISLTNLIQLNNSENFELKNFVHTFGINISSMDKNNCFINLKTLELTNISITLTLFESLIQMFPNIEKLTIGCIKVIYKRNRSGSICSEMF